MITRTELDEVCAKSIQMIEAAGVSLTDSDKQNVTAADFGLSRLKQEGIQILNLFATNRIAAKILVLLPFQTEPEHSFSTTVRDVLDQFTDPDIVRETEIVDG